MIAVKRIAWTLLTLVFCAGLFTPSVHAESKSIYFPYVVNDAQTTTELIFTNPSGKDANISLSFVTDDGAGSLSTLGSIQVPSGAQSIVGSTTLGGFTGWVLANSDAAGVVGDVRVSSADRSAQEIAPSAQIDKTIVFPLALQAAGSSTEIAIVNPTPFNTRLSMTVYDNTGKAISTIDTSLAAMHALRGTLSTIFGGDKDYTTASHVVATSIPQNIFSTIVSITGFEVVRGFSRNLSDASLEKISRRNDWAALPAAPMTSAGTSVVFADVIRGLNWFSLIGLVNVTNSSQTVTLTYSTATNANAGVKSVSIPANGSLRSTAVDLFGAGQDAGSVKVTSTGNVTGFLAIGSAGGLSIGAAPGRSKGETDFIFPTVDETSPSITGIALRNDGSTSANVDLYLMSAKGETLGHSFQIVAPQQQIAKLARDFFVEGLNQTGGYIFVHSSAALFGMSVVGNPDKSISQSSGEAAPGGFTPPAQGLFIIRGRVTDNITGSPASGVTITLSRVGTADVVMPTDGNGEFTFRNLGVGDYTVTPSQAGKMFSPSSALVRLTTDSKNLTFVRDSAPTISAVTVVTNDPGSSAASTAGNNPDPYAVFGTSEVSVKITGSNFVRGESVFFGSTAVAASNVNFIDANTMFVKLILNSAQILQQLVAQGYYGQYLITIGGQSPFDSVRSNAVAFYILPPLPVLLTVSPQQTFARYEIDSTGDTITVTGYGFRQGARILFDGQTSLNGVEIDTRYVSSTQLQAYLPPQVLRYGGIYNLRVRNQSLLPEVSGEAVSFQVNNLRPEITSLDAAGTRDGQGRPVLAIIGPGTEPVSVSFTINGSNFHPAAADPAAQDPGTVAFITLKIPDLFPALVPANGINQCVIVNSRGVLGVTVFDISGNPAPGVTVTFTAPGIDSVTASGFFPPTNASTVTAVSDAQGFASVLFQANPFSGSYPVTAKATVGGIPLQTAIVMTNANPGEGCPNPVAKIVVVSSTQIIVTGFAINQKGVYSVVVANNSPGGGVSSAKEFVVAAGVAGGVPAIRSTDPLSPATRPAGSSTFNLTVYRDSSSSVPFQSDAWVNFGTVRLNRIAGDSDSIVVQVPDFLIASPGLVPISVTNPGTGGNTGGTSGRVYFTVQ